MANGWGIFTLGGALVFDVDSVLDLKQNGKAKTSDFPVELGAFASFNKVQEPDATKIQLAVGGAARISAFQAALKVEKASCHLYNIVTPTMTYLNVTLEGYDFSQTAENGSLSMLVVDLAFREVREVTPAYSSLPLAKAKNPTSASKQVGGKAQPQKPAGPPPLAWNNVVSRAENG